jgi:hypothetical protein
MEISTQLIFFHDVPRFRCIAEIHEKPSHVKRDRKRFYVNLAFRVILHQKVGIPSGLLISSPVLDYRSSVTAMASNEVSPSVRKPHMCVIVVFCIERDIPDVIP